MNFTLSEEQKSIQELARKFENWAYLVQMLIQQGQFLQIIGKFRDAENTLLGAEKEITNLRSLPMKDSH